MTRLYVQFSVGKIASARPTGAALELDYLHRMKWGMARGLAAWILLSIGGVLIVLIPDEGNRLFSLS